MLLLEAFTIIVILIVAYCHYREGLFTAACMCVNVVLAGLIAFNFWEPLAGAVESVVDRTFLQGYEDFVCLMFLFALSLGLLRALTHHFNSAEVVFQPALNQLGAAAMALITGYLLSGFLVCAMETLPWHQNFGGFEPYRENETGIRRYLPPDRIWLSLMHRAGATCLSRGDESRTFDPEGAFESNYFRFRRYADAPPEAPKQ
jgi:hypothetical protein